MCELGYEGTITYEWVPLSRFKGWDTEPYDLATLTWVRDPGHNLGSPPLGLGP